MGRAKALYTTDKFMEDNLCYQQIFQFKTLPTSEELAVPVEGSFK
jgi:hypothetical protein